MSEDRRVRRTQKLLGEALIAVARQKGYKNITIQDVTTQADIGYRTFFRHYSGLDELLVSVAEDRLDQLYEILDLPQLANLSGDPINLFQRVGATLFQHIQENQDNLRHLLLDDSMRFVFDPVLERAVGKLEAFITALPGAMLPASLAANHIIASVFSLIRWWLENDLRPSPPEMGDIFTDLVIKPTWLTLAGPPA